MTLPTRWDLLVGDIIPDVLHQVDLVVNAIPGVDEPTSITQRNVRTSITRFSRSGRGLYYPGIRLRLLSRGQFQQRGRPLHY